MCFEFLISFYPIPIETPKIEIREMIWISAEILEVHNTEPVEEDRPGEKMDLDQSILQEERLLP